MQGTDVRVCTSVPLRF